MIKTYIIFLLFIILSYQKNNSLKSGLNSVKINKPIYKNIHTMLGNIYTSYMTISMNITHGKLDLIIISDDKFNITFDKSLLISNSKFIILNKDNDFINEFYNIVSSDKIIVFSKTNNATFSYSDKLEYIKIKEIMIFLIVGIGLVCIITLFISSCILIFRKRLRR